MHAEQRLDIPATVTAQALELLEASSDGIVFLDTDWRLTHVNRETEWILGSSRADLVGHDLWELYPELSVSELGRQLRRARAAGEPLSLLASGKPFSAPVGVQIYPSAQGLTLRLRNTHAPSRADEDCVGVLFENNPLPGFVFDEATLDFLAVNRAARELYGYSREEFLSRKLPDILLPNDIPIGVERSRGGRAWREEGRHRTCEGRVVEVEACIRTVDYQGRGARLAVVQDITERKQGESGLMHAREVAEQANRAKTEFISRLSHELRTPLNAMLGFAQLLQIEASDASDRESVEQILAGGQHLLTLLDEVLDITRIESGRIRLAREAVPLGEVLEECLALLAPVAEERNVRMPAPAAELLSARVLADRVRLKQVLLGLLSTAIRSTPAGGAPDLVCETLGDECWRISIGAGVDGEELERLFQPFERLKVEGDTEADRGLGLAHVKVLVEAMHGRIGVETTAPRSGGRLWIELPVAALQPEGEPVVAAEDVPAAPALKILYIEDDPGNLRLIQRVLARRPGTELLTAMQGSLGVELALRHRPDLILLDLQLPDLSGEQILFRLRREPETRDTPVVILAGEASEMQRRILLELGAREYLTKPLDIRKLFEVVDRIGGAEAED